MKNIRVLLSEVFQFLEVKFSIYLNGHVFVMFDLSTGIWSACKKKQYQEQTDQTLHSLQPIG